MNKKVIVTILFLIMIITAISTTLRAENQTDEEIVIEDDVLRAVINREIDETRKSDHVILKSEMEGLKKIDVSDLKQIYDREEGRKQGPKHRGIKSLSGLQYAINLEYLDVSENEIYDFSPIENLKKLKHLDVNRNYATNLEAISKLTNLEYLNIYNLELSNLMYIDRLVNLKHLDFHFNCQEEGKKLSDISPLEALKNLEYLNIESNDISDISVLSKLKNIKNLGIGANFITDLRPVKERIKDIWIDDKYNGDTDYYMGSAMQFVKKERVLLDENGLGELKNPTLGLEEYKTHLRDLYEVNVPIIMASYDGILMNYDYDRDVIIIKCEENVERKLLNLTLNYDNIMVVFKEIEIVPYEEAGDEIEDEPIDYEDDPIYVAPNYPTPPYDYYVDRTKENKKYKEKKEAKKENGNKNDRQNEEELLFSDIGDSKYKNDIIELKNAGIINGTSDELFSPKDNLSRAMAISILRRISTNTGFSVVKLLDVSEKDWYYEDMLWGYGHNILKGDEEKRLIPDKNLTYEELALIIVRFIKAEELEISKVREYSGLTNHISSWAKDAVLSAYEMGLFEDINDVNKNVTREDYAHIIYVLNKLIK